MRSTHPLARAFMDRARGWCAYNGVTVSASAGDDFGLVLVVRHMPREAFTEAWRRNLPGHNQPLFLKLGEGLWAHLYSLGMSCVSGDQLVAVMLDPRALDHWREVCAAEAEAA